MKEKNRILMIYASDKSIYKTAPGMVMLDICKYSRNDISIICHKTKDVKSEDRILALEPNLLSNIFGEVLKFLPHRLKKEWFNTVNLKYIKYNVAVLFKLLWIRPKAIVVHVSYSMCRLIYFFYPKTQIIYYHHGGNLHIKLNEKKWGKLVKASNNLIISVTDYVRINCEQKFITQPQKIITIHNGKSILIPEKYDELRTQLYKPDDMVFCYAGRITVEKGIIPLLNVTDKICNLYPNIKLLFIGKLDLVNTPKDAVTIQNKVNELNIKRPGTVHITGELKPEIAIEYINISDASVLLSQTAEGNSLFLIESMHCSKAIITTNIGGNPEINTNQIECGIIIDVNEKFEESLEEAMINLLTNEQLRIKLGESGRIRANQEFTIENMVRKFDSAIEVVISKQDE